MDAKKTDELVGGEQEDPRESHTVRWRGQALGRTCWYNNLPSCVLEIVVKNSEGLMYFLVHRDYRSREY